MASKREQILAAIKNNLANTTGVGDRIYRSRAEPMARAESPSLVLEFITDEPGINPLMGWESSTDTLSELKLEFEHHLE